MLLIKSNYFYTKYIVIKSYHNDCVIELFLNYSGIQHLNYPTDYKVQGRIDSPLTNLFQMYALPNLIIVINRS